MSLSIKYKPIKLSLSNIKEEVCGVFYWNQFYQNVKFKNFTNNSHENKSSFFVTGDNDFNNLLKSEKILSLFHSHTDSKEDPSPTDIEVSESLCLPSYIFSNQTKKTFLYYPKSQKSPKLLSRTFVPEFQDCVTIIKDFFKLNSLPINWSRDGINSNQKLIKYLDKYFHEVNVKNLQPKDVLVFKPDFSPLYHAAILLRDGNILHHPLNMLSNKQLLTDKHLANVYKVYRYKE